MAVKFRAKFDDTKLRAQLRDMLKEGQDLRPYLKRVGAWMLGSVNKNWRTGGARFQSGGWKTLSGFTLAIRAWREEKYGRPAYTKKILEVRGELRRNWEYRVKAAGKGQMALEVGSPVPYAEVHQKGKTVSVPKYVHWRVRTKKIPRRTLIAIAPDDFKQAGRFADQFLRRTVTESK